MHSLFAFFELTKLFDFQREERFGVFPHDSQCNYSACQALLVRLLPRSMTQTKMRLSSARLWHRENSAWFHATLRFWACWYIVRYEVLVLPWIAYGSGRCLLVRSTLQRRTSHLFCVFCLWGTPLYRFNECISSIFHTLNKVVLKRIHWMRPFAQSIFHSFMWFFMTI